MRSTSENDLARGKLDLDAREKAGTARHVETLDATTTAEIIARVVSILDPEN